MWIKVHQELAKKTFCTFCHECQDLIPNRHKRSVPFSSFYLTAYVNVKSK